MRGYCRARRGADLAQEPPGAHEPSAGCGRSPRRDGVPVILASPSVQGTRGKGLGSRLVPHSAWSGEVLSPSDTALPRMNAHGDSNGVWSADTRTTGRPYLPASAGTSNPYRIVETPTGIAAPVRRTHGSHVDTIHKPPVSPNLPAPLANPFMSACIIAFPVALMVLWPRPITSPYALTTDAPIGESLASSPILASAAPPPFSASTKRWTKRQGF